MSRENELLFTRQQRVLLDTVYDQEFRCFIPVLTDQVLVFYFQVTLELAEVAWFLDHTCLYLDRFNKIVTYIHHQFHSGWLIGQSKSNFFLEAIPEVLFF